MLVTDVRSFPCTKTDATGPPLLDALYFDAIQGWLQTFPTRQIFVMQYEELKENPKKAIFDLMLFLGLDPGRLEAEFDPKSLVSEPPPEPVVLGRGQFQRLSRIAREDALNLVGVLERYGLADATSWIARWRDIWDRNLVTCPERDMTQCRFSIGLD